MKTHGWYGSERPKFSLEERIKQRHQARLIRLAWRDRQRGWGKKCPACGQQIPETVNGDSK